MTYPLSILIVLKNGEINSLNIKDFKEDDLFKKCGFKTITNFNKQHEWNIELDNVYYIISMYGKNVGKCNMLNTYVFPSPINNITYFGSCCLVASTTNNGTMSMSTHLNLNSNLWDLLCNNLHIQNGTTQNTKPNDLVNINYSDVKTNNKLPLLINDNVTNKNDNILKKCNHKINDNIIDNVVDNVNEFIEKELVEEQYEY